jgi:signal transduction histidine kinase
VTRAFSALAALVLVGCSVALAQTGVAVAEPIPWGAISAAMTALVGALAAVAKAAHNLSAAVHKALGALDARATAFETTVRDGFAGGLVRLDRIETEQRRSSDASIASGVRLQCIEHEVEAIHGRLDVTTAPRKPKATVPA